MGIARTAFVAGQGNHIALMNQLGVFKNLLKNPGFTINQRAYVSAAALSSGTYGHDRWKAGSGGGDYTFTQLPSFTQVTIAANKTLIQVVEDKDVAGGQYVLSWVGTAQARYGINGAAPSGSYASSPIVIASAGAGQTISVEFGNGASAGTLAYPQLELAVADPTDIGARPFSVELEMAQRYCFNIDSNGANDIYIGAGGNQSTTTAIVVVPVPRRMRAAPTLSVSAAADFSVVEAGAAIACTALAIVGAGVDFVGVQATVAAGLTNGRGVSLRLNAAASKFFRLTSEL